MASQLSGVRPNAFERRKAISGLTALLPFNTRLNVEAATPSVVASSRPPLMSLGSRYTELMNSPGCGGYALPSVIILVIQDVRMPIPEFKRQPPVSIDPNRPTTYFLALERMKPKSPRFSYILKIYVLRKPPMSSRLDLPINYCSRFRPSDNRLGVARATVAHALAADLGLNETQVIHYALKRPRHRNTACL